MRGMAFNVMMGLLVAVVIGMAGCGGGGGGTQTTSVTKGSMKIVNNTGQTIEHVYLGTASSNNWGADLLSSSIANGSTRDIVDIPTGSYDVKVVLANGSIHYEFGESVLVGATTTCAIDSTASPAPAAPVQTPTPTSANYTNTLLLKGTWFLSETIYTTTFTDKYVLDTMINTPDSNGYYYISGTDIYGKNVMGRYAYSSLIGSWSLLNPGSIIDMFYVFDTDGTNVLPGGCYYQISHPSETWSPCYSLSGYKTALTSLMIVSKTAGDVAKEIGDIEKANLAEYSQPDETVKMEYLKLKSAAGK